VRASDVLCGGLAAHAVFDTAVSCVCPPGRTLLAGRCVAGSDAVCAAAAAPPLPSQRRALPPASPAAASAANNSGIWPRAAAWDGRECGCPAGLSLGLGGCIAGSTGLCQHLFGPGRVWSATSGECRCGPGLAEMWAGGGCVAATAAVCQWRLGRHGRIDTAAATGCGCEVGYTADVNGTCEQGSDGLCRARGGGLGRFDGVGRCVCEAGAQPDPLGLCVAPGAGGVARGDVDAGRGTALGDGRGRGSFAATVRARRLWEAADADGDGALGPEEVAGWKGTEALVDRDQVGQPWHS
jgi:hypothetical protein